MVNVNNGEKDGLPLLDIKNESHSVQLESSDFDATYPFNEKDTFQNEQFWIEVYDYPKKSDANISPAKAQRIVRTEWLKRNLPAKSDLLFYLLTTIHDRYKKYCVDKDKVDLFPTFQFELSEFTLVILELDEKEKQKKYRRSKQQLDGSRKNVLHLAAERNLVNVAEHILEFYPSIISVTSSQEINGTFIQKKPIEYALELFHDDVAALLINAMENASVRLLFESTNGIEPAKFKFEEYIKHKKMKKTVMAVLDCLMHPDWPFIPVNVNNNESEESAALAIPNMPIRYHFNYRLLDGDNEGRPGKFDDGKDAMRHPVVRMLVRRKWDKYGRRKMRIYFFSYLLFLVMMSLSFFLSDHSKSFDKKIMIFDILTIIFTVGYVLLEVQQLIQEKSNYFWDPFNYFDVIGLFLLLTVYTLRYSNERNIEMIIACAAYCVNFLRVFKYFPAFRNLGLYTKTFAEIIYMDISKFSLVFMVVVLAFSGGCYLALQASTGFKNVGGFWSILLQEIRALTEAQGFADDYSDFSVLVIIFLMVNMFCILVILLNILIGQISYRYEVAVQHAIIQYDIDRIKLITRLEYNWFQCCNDRLKYYVDGDYENGEEIENDLLTDWLVLKEGNSTLTRNKTAVKMLLKQKVKKKATNENVLMEIDNVLKKYYEKEADILK